MCPNLTNFVGRESEFVQIRAKLSAGRANFVQFGQLSRPGERIVAQFGQKGRPGERIVAQFGQSCRPGERMWPNLVKVDGQESKFGPIWPN